MSETNTMQPAPLGARCGRCGDAETVRLIEMTIGEEPLGGFVCEACEEILMIEISKEYEKVRGQVEAMIGLHRWRRIKAARVWPDEVM